MTAGLTRILFTTRCRWTDAPNCMQNLEVCGLINLYKNCDFNAQSNFLLTSLWASHLTRKADQTVSMCVCGSRLIRSEKRVATVGASASFVSAVLPSAFSDYHLHSSVIKDEDHGRRKEGQKANPRWQMKLDWTPKKWSNQRVGKKHLSVCAFSKVQCEE